MVYNKNVPKTSAREMQIILGVSHVQHHEKYIGLPSAVGKSKKEVFASLRERVWQKLQGWKERLLSQAGKEILIKAVAQSILTYTMGCFKLPEYLCSDLESLAPNFWWGQKERERIINWVKWSNMCKGKNNGGMDFRDLRTFNMAMLAVRSFVSFKYKLY